MDINTVSIRASSRSTSLTKQNPCCAGQPHDSMHSVLGDPKLLHEGLLIRPHQGFKIGTNSFITQFRTLPILKRSSQYRQSQRKLDSRNTSLLSPHAWRPHLALKSPPLQGCPINIQHAAQTSDPALLSLHRNVAHHAHSGGTHHTCTSSFSLLPNIYVNHTLGQHWLCTRNGSRRFLGICAPARHGVCAIILFCQATTDLSGLQNPALSLITPTWKTAGHKAQLTANQGARSMSRPNNSQKCRLTNVHARYEQLLSRMCSACRWKNMQF